MFEKQYLT